MKKAVYPLKFTAFSVDIPEKSSKISKKVQMLLTLPYAADKIILLNPIKGDYMAKKNIGIIFPQKKTSTIAVSLSENLRFVFGSSINVFIYVLSELAPGAPIDGDLFLLLLEDGFLDLKGHIDNLNNVFPITRAIRRSAVPKIATIPNGTDVLVVNDNYELTIQVTNNLLELGFDHANWIPYNPAADPDTYQKISYAVTPNEMEYVPAYIPNVINIGDRFIDTYTMVRIAGKLHLGSDVIDGNLLRYSNLLAEPESSIANRYLGDIVKSELLKQYFQTYDKGILFCDTEYRLIYANNLFYRFFSQDNSTASGSSLLRMLGKTLFDKISDKTFTSDILSVENSNYAVTKAPVSLGDMPAGYCITWQDERSIQELKSTLNTKLIQSGLYARHSFRHILCKSQRMKDCISRAKKAAETDYTVLIDGESGTGKELLAQSIHNGSSRRNSPFVAINCAALPESLLESELFGYESGAFTGAKKSGKAGLFEQANTGTIFLDEIGDMPLNLQALLLRVLQEKQIMRIGSDRVISVDVRILAATNKELLTEAEEGRFRKDLFYRLNILPIHLPPLRERREDIPLLFRHFLGDDYDLLSLEEKEFLSSRLWPGNIRQLENCAYYYKTMGAFSGFFPDEDDRPRKGSLPRENSRRETPCGEEEILSIIAAHSTETHGIGRNAILELLHRTWPELSDAWLRKKLSDLQDRGLISIGKGRMGCRPMP